MKIRVFFALLLLGFTSLLVQTVIIREFLISFYGNELIISIILANWILLVALGSMLFSRLSPKVRRPILFYTILQTGIALYLPFSIFLIRVIKGVLGLSLGEGVGIPQILFSSFFILAPSTILIGGQFPFACRIFSDLSKKPLESIGRVYILEAIGFILAGPTATYLLITKLNAFQIVFLVGIINLLSAMLLLKNDLKDRLIKKQFTIVALFLSLLIFVFFGFSQRIHSLSIKHQWRNQNVLDYRNSIYANLVVTKAKDQYTFYSNGIPIISTPLPDIVSVEELAHFVILSHEDPKELLILSGGAGGLIKEILKYNIERVDYAELDPTLIQLIKKFPNELTEEELGDSRLHIKNIDGRRFVRLANHKYDVILTNLPFPSTLQLNRFYTEEFFRDIKYLLKENGIFAFHLAGSLSYIGSELRNLNGSILNTLKNAFAYVRIIPGDSNLYLASKSSFQVEPNIFISRIKKRGIPTKMISDAYLRYRLDTGWLSWFTNSMGDLSQIRRNLDLLPSAVFYSLSYWNAQFSQKLQVFFGILDRLRFRFLLILIGLIGLILFLCQRAFPRLKRLSIGFAICTTGFTGMSVNLIAIFTYQSFYGFIFQHFALLTMAFMAGLSLGSWIITRKINQAEIDIFFFLKVEFVLVAFCAALGPLLFYLDKAPAENLAFIFFILQALVGFLVGVEFPLANKIYWRNREGHSQGAGFLYGLDLMGSWSATLIVGIALVPIIGIVKTSILLAAIKLTSLILIITSSKRSLLC